VDAEGIKHNVPNVRFEKWQINQNGFRGPGLSSEKPSSVLRIVCMGSSETFGLFEAPGKEWPAQLRHLLKPHYHLEVINASVAGLSPRHYKPYLKKYVLDYEPDIVIIYANPFFYASKIQKRPDRETKHLNRTRKSHNPRRNSSPTFDLSLRLSPKLKQSLKQVIPPQALDHYYRWRLANQINHLEETLLLGKKPLDQPPEDIVTSFSSDLLDLVRFLLSRQIDVVLSSYPALISKENISEHLPILLDNRRFCIGISLNGMVRFLDECNRVAQKIAHTYPIGFVDNSSILPKDPKYFADNVHYTDEGAKRVAANIASYVLDTYREVPPRPCAQSYQSKRPLDSNDSFVLRDQFN
jgi:hypothetical protein